MLDRLAEDPLLEADVADVDARERIGRLLHQDFLEGAEGIVVILVQHLRPAEQRLSLRLSGGELKRFRERLNRTGVVAERDQTPALLDECGRADVIGVEHRPLPGEFRSGGLLCVRGDLFVAIDELADIVLELRQLTQHAVHLLEEGDDLTLRRLALGVSRRATPLELPRDSIVFPAKRRDRCFCHHVAPCKAIFSFALSNLLVFKTTIVPILPPSNSSMTVRVSSRSGAAAPRRLRKSTSGIAPPWYWRTPSRNSGALGSGAGASYRRMRST